MGGKHPQRHPAFGMISTPHPDPTLDRPVTAPALDPTIIKHNASHSIVDSAEAEANERHAAD
jgi:hypothetical protein